MTLNELKGQLINYFVSNDTLEITQINDLFSDFANKPLLKEMVTLALKDLEELSLVKPCVTNPIEKQKVNPEYDTWILIKSLYQFSQSVEVNGLTATSIAEIINDFCDQYNDEENKCDPLNISEKDIVNLLKLIVSLKGLDNENSQEDNNDE